MDAASKKLTEFLVSSDDTVTEKMHMDFSVVPPVLVLKDGEKFVALDPGSSRFFIDPNFQFSYDYNFSAVPEIQDKVDKWGKSLMDKARADYLSSWLENMNF